MLERRIQGLSPAKLKLLQKKLAKAKRALSSNESKQVGPDGDLALSQAQKRIWFVEQLCGKTAAFNEAVKIRLHGCLNMDALQAAFSALCQRHPVLASRFLLVDGEPVQRLASGITHIPKIDLSSLDSVTATTDKDHQNLLDDWVRQQTCEPFNLEQSPPLRVSVLSTGDQLSWLVVVFHHIAFDAWSAHIIAKDLSDYYNRYLLNPLGLAEVAPEVGMHSLVNHCDTETQQLEYWKSQLAGAQRFNLVRDFVANNTVVHRSDIEEIFIPSSIYSRLKEILKDVESTTFSLLLCAFYLLLYRQTGSQDITVGSSVINRDDSILRRIVGPLLNTLVLRAQIDPQDNIRCLIEKVSGVVRGALANKDVAFEQLVTALNVERDAQTHPFFQIAFLFNNTPKIEISLAGLDIKIDVVSSGYSPFEMFWFAEAKDDGLLIQANYSTDLYRRETIKDMLVCYKNILREIVLDWTRSDYRQNGLLRVSDVNLIYPEQYQNTITKFNSTDMPWSKTDFVSRFEDVCRRYPDLIAVEHERQSITYEQLDTRSNQIAQYLISQSIHAESLVAVCLPRSIDFIAVILGVLKAGAAFVPIEVKFPKERITQIVTDCQASLLICHSKDSCNIQDEPEQLSIDQLLNESKNCTSESLGTVITGRQLAYLIYTSGSTGKPKGVAVEHSGLDNLASWQNRYFSLSPGSRISQFATVAFDGAIGEIAMALLNAGTLVMLERDNVSPDELIDTLNKQKINLAVFVPSLLKILEPEKLAHPKDLTIVSVGEICPPELAMRWRQHCHFVNAYGPSEGTVYSHAYRVVSDNGDNTLSNLDYLSESCRVPVGLPMDNVKSYILDQDLNPVPLGCVGQLYFSGANLARGYYLKPGLTASKFLPNPFARGHLPEQLSFESALNEIQRFKNARQQEKPLRALDTDESNIDGELNSATKAFISSIKESSREACFKRYVNEGMQGSYQACGINKDILSVILDIDDFTGKQGVDFGFGNGEVLDILADLGAEVKGLDFVPQFISAAKQKGRDAELASVDVTSSAFLSMTSVEPQTLDFAISNLVLDRVAHPRRMLTNLISCLKPGGRFAVQTLLPVVPYDDNPQLEALIEYTPQENRVVHGNNLLDDANGMIALMEELGECSVNVHRFPYAVSSTDGVQEYDVWSFSGNKGVKHAQQECTADDHDRLYQTGDLARYRSDGCIEIMGREDHQVKIRGYRVELEEIEKVIRQFNDVSDVAVDAKELEAGPAGKKIVAYLVVPQEGFPDTGVHESALREYLNKKLPVFMRPSYFIYLQTLPYSTVGKLDRTQLPNPSSQVSSQVPQVTQRSVPQSEDFQTLQTTCASILQLEHIAPEDNLFELGADSILIIQIVAQLKKSAINLSVEQFFEHQTLLALAGELSSSNTATSVTPSEEELLRDYPLTPIQSWYVEQSVNPKTAYNQSLVLSLVSPISAPQLESLVTHLLNKHAMLRVRLTQRQGHWRQHLACFESSNVCTVVDGTKWEDYEGRFAELINEQQQSLDLVEASCRFTLVNSAQGQQLLMIIHHMAIDVVSWYSLVGELENLLNNVASSDLPKPVADIAYLKWAQWLEAAEQNGRFDLQVDYWKSILLGKQPQRPGPVDAAVTSMSKTSLVLSEQRTKQFENLAISSYASVYDCLLAAVAYTQKHQFGDESLLVMLETHGREYVPTEIPTGQTLGWFTAMFPLRLELATTDSVADFISDVYRQKRTVQSRGLEYGILRYSQRHEKELSQLENSIISFNYLGKVDGQIADSQCFSSLTMLNQPQTSVGRVKGLEIIAYIQNGQLAIEVHHDGSLKGFELDQFADGLSVSLERFCEQQVLGNLADSASIEITPIQHGMLMHCLTNPSTGVYMNQLHVKVCGELDTQTIQCAWQLVLDNCPALRVGFSWEEGNEPTQFVSNNNQCGCLVSDWRGQSDGQQQAEFQRWLAKDRHQDFDYKAPPLMRLHLLRLKDKEYRMVWTFHHLLADGWSVALIFKQFAETYQDLIDAKAPNLTRAQPFFEQVSWAAGKSKEDQRPFWREHLEHASPMPLLPIDKGPTAADSMDKVPGEVTHQLCGADSERLREFCRVHRLTVNSVFTGLWSLLLSRYTGQTDTLFGVTMSGRSADMPDMENSIGMFINTVPLAVQVHPEQQALAWFKALQKRQVSLQAVQFSPLADVLRWAELPAVEHAINSVVLFENYPVKALSGMGAQALNFSDFATVQQSNFPLLLVVVPGASIKVQLGFDQDRFSQQDMTLLLERMMVLLYDFLENSESKLCQLSTLTDADNELLRDFAEQPYQPGQSQCLHTLFEQQVEQTPEKIAVCDGGKELSFTQLNCLANQYAHSLIANGVKAESVVGLYVRRSIDMYVGILAILKAGAAYLPLDPKLPGDRVTSIVQSAGISTVLTQSGFQASLDNILNTQSRAAHRVNLLSLDKMPDSMANLSSENPKMDCSLENLAYVMFTSGTSGIPKGVLGTHASTFNCLDWMWQEEPFAEHEVCCQKTSFTFGDSIQEILGPLFKGVTTHIISDATILDTDSFVAQLGQMGITRIVLVPSLLRMLLDNCNDIAQKLPDLEYWLASGEALPESLVTKFNALLPGRRLMNMYGASELSNDVTIFHAKADNYGREYAPIGRPVAGMQVYLLDEQMQQVAPGIVGEIYVGGCGVNRGYMNEPGLSAKSFVPNPYSANGGERLYQTGDNGYLNHDGELVFKGRKDQQVNLRGFRIELEEIIKVAEAYDGVKQCFATTLPNQLGEEQLAVAVEITREQKLLNSAHCYTLENGMPILHRSKAESDYLFMEIFESQDYIQAGIQVPPGGVVIDVGANIGMFSLFAHYRFGATVYAVEPAPENVALLKQNFELHGCKGSVFPCGCGATETELIFTFYPGASLTSGFHANPDLDGQIFKSAAIKGLIEGDTLEHQAVSENIDLLVDQRLEPVQLMAPVKPLSTILAQTGEQNIDLLKIDVERSEWEVLQGISEADWPRIKQLAIEVEDIQGKLEAIEALLLDKGYRVTAVKSEHFPDIELYMVYAKMSDYAVSSPSSGGLKLFSSPYPTALNTSTAALAALFREKLPAYMTPSIIIQLDSLEKNKSGKLDRAAVKTQIAQALKKHTRPVSAPENDTEQMISDIWQDFLQLNQIDRNDSFFELGGHSLLVMQVCNEISQRSGKSMTFIDLFRYPTVAGLAKFISGNQEETNTEASDRGKRRRQRRLSKKRNVVKESSDV